jgi:hypothetical protein
VLHASMMMTVYLNLCVHLIFREMFLLQFLVFRLQLGIELEWQHYCGLTDLSDSVLWKNRDNAERGRT